MKCELQKCRFFKQSKVIKNNKIYGNCALSETGFDKFIYLKDDDESLSKTDCHLEKEISKVKKLKRKYEIIEEELKMFYKIRARREKEYDCK